MLISTHFDGGIAQNATVGDGEITFDLRPGQKLLNVLLRDTPAVVTLHFLVDGKSLTFLVGQGILLSEDGVSWRAEPVTNSGPERWSTTVATGGKDLRVANRHHYGRDGIDRLLCDLHGNLRVRPRMLRRDYRSLMLFECGQDDGRKPVHYVIAGEDVGESSGTIVADHMIRLLAGGEGDLLSRSLVRIVPLASLHCAGRPTSPSYDTLAGKGIYGAATWGDDRPPPEYAVLRDLVDETIAQRRLALMLTIHSWQSQHDHTGMEFIRSGGAHRLSPDRELAATAALHQLIQGVPRGRSMVADKCWYPGLARDYLMARHNVVSYRVEISTTDNPACDYAPTARAFLRNIAAVKDWAFVYPA